MTDQLEPLELPLHCAAINRELPQMMVESKRYPLPSQGHTGAFDET